MKESKIRNLYSVLFTAFKQVRSTGVRKTGKLQVNAGTSS
jgi:hypothetical protein